MVENKCLVAVDATSSDPRIVVVRPPVSLSRQDAVLFAAHLVAYANSAQNEKTPGKIEQPAAFAARCDRRSALVAKVMVQDDGSIVLLGNLGLPLTVEDALDLAADVARMTDPADVVLAVGEVVDGHAGGGALRRTLQREGHEVKLGVPIRQRLSLADVAEEYERDEGAAGAERKRGA